MIKKLLKISFLFCFLIITIIILADKMIISKTKKNIFDNVNDIPYNKVAMVLGTSKFLRGGIDNPYFTYRIKAAKELYDAGKVKIFVLSGDNNVEHYNEPQDMKDDLVRLGIPEENIYLDYAGFRTLDSVVRMREIFGTEKFTIISQKFHNERAVFTAKMKGMETCGYNAKDVSLKFGLKVVIREKFARVKALLDLLFSKKPKFLGEKIEIT